jgi:xylulokinase
MTYSGASSLQWLADQFGIPRDPDSYDELLSLAAEVPIGSEGVLFMPYLGGRGTPHAAPTQKGGFLNLSLSHGRPEMTRSVLEGIAYAIREIYEEFDRLGFMIGDLMMTGGGVRSDLWRQIIVDVLHQEASIAGGDSTLGNAIIAAVGSGTYQHFDEACQAMVVEISNELPVESQVAEYEGLYRSYQRVRDVLVTL